MDFSHLQLPSTPNYYLSCPKECSLEKANQESPVFNVNITKLANAWEALIKKQQRLQTIDEDPEKHLYNYVQRTRLFRFPDFITVQLIAIDANHSTIAIFSRAKYGYSDFGVNRRRVQCWLKLLSLGTSPINPQLC